MLRFIRHAMVLGWWCVGLLKVDVYEWALASEVVAETGAYGPPRWEWRPAGRAWKWRARLMGDPQGNTAAMVRIGGPAERALARMTVPKVDPELVAASRLVTALLRVRRARMKRGDSRPIVVCLREENIARWLKSIPLMTPLEHRCDEHWPEWAVGMKIKAMAAQ